MAIRVFADPLHLSEQDRIEGGEYRWRTIGLVDGIRMIVVAHSWHTGHEEKIIRIISARSAERAERRRYER